MARKATKKISPVRKSILTTAKDMLAGGVMDKRGYDKVVKQLGVAPQNAQPMTSDEIRQLRTKAKMSQAVFAKSLHVTTGYVSQLERGTKRPTGPTLVLLNVIQRHGIELII